MSNIKTYKVQYTVDKGATSYSYGVKNVVRADNITDVLRYIIDDPSFEKSIECSISTINYTQMLELLSDNISVTTTLKDFFDIFWLNKKITFFIGDMDMKPVIYDTSIRLSDEGKRQYKDILNLPCRVVMGGRGVTMLCSKEDQVEVDFMLHEMQDYANGGYFTPCFVELK